MNIREAINHTLHAEMERDPSIIVLGEDVVGGAGTAGGQEAIGGIWGTTGGLYAKFGAERVIDTPISESAPVGAAAGAATAGQRPVAALVFRHPQRWSLAQPWDPLCTVPFIFSGKKKSPE